MASIKSNNAQEKKWQAESNLSTLIEAAKIKNDKARFKAAMVQKAERMKALEELGKSNNSTKEKKGEKY